LRPLAVILALALVVVGCGAPGVKKPQAPVQAAPRANQLPPPTGQLPQVEFAYDAADVRDPFVPLYAGGMGPDLSRLRIEGVVLAPLGNYAVVNDMVVTAGDQLAGCAVTGIDESGISLDFAGEKFFIAIPAAE